MTAFIRKYFGWLFTADPNYSVNHANFAALSEKYGELTPQMLYTCPDFEVVFEVRVG